MLSLPGLEIYPSKRKVFRDRQEIQLTAKEYESFYCLRPTRGVYLHTAKSTRRYGEISPLAARATLSAFTSAIYGKSCTRQLPMLPSTSDPSGKSDTALKYKQKNEMNSNQLPDCCSFHFSKFFLRLYSSGDSPNCFLKTAANFP